MNTIKHQNFHVRQASVCEMTIPMTGIEQKASSIVCQV